jgi:hypothetical protein
LSREGGKGFDLDLGALLEGFGCLVGVFGCLGVGSITGDPLTFGCGYAGVDGRPFGILKDAPVCSNFSMNRLLHFCSIKSNLEAGY